MSLDELYSKWYDTNKYDTNFVLLCWGLLQHINYDKLCWDDKIKCDTLYDSIRYAMEDCLNGYN